MADQTPEGIAFELFKQVAANDGKRATNSTAIKADRKWILDTYAECLLAVKQPAQRKRKK